MRGPSTREKRLRRFTTPDLLQCYCQPSIKMNSPSPNTPERRSGGSHAATAAGDVDIVTPAKKNHDSDDDCGEDCSVNREEDNMAEIKDLQRSLEYLISDKRQSNTNNNEQEGPEESSVPTTAQHYNQDANDETLCQIPNLVNRILMAHYSPPPPPSQSHKRRDIQYSTREKMTQLLIAVIIEFAEPYFVRITRHREGERKKQLHEKEQEPQKKKKSKRQKGVEEKENGVSSKLGFEDRAVSWATRCLKLLLQPSLSTLEQNDNRSEEKVIDDLHIAELDALLAATGPNDGYELEQRMQQALLLGIQARSIFMSSCIAGWHSKKN